ncbi:MAG: GNAT family N-acetyltransferase [Nocardioides sp.]|nr:GNAT family N-acetyltransferase [Nocardioides sp.]
MTSISDLFPPLGLRATAGPVELRGIGDDDLVTLAELAVAGIHEPDRMPFFFPWTDVPADELPMQFVKYHWKLRAEWSPSSWELNLGVWFEGTLVGVQGVSTRDFLVTRAGETGSWLGQAQQGRGIGTAMRQAICALCFDHLGFTEITSGAFVDNPASLAVSRKVGYRLNGVRRLARRPGELAVNQGLVLSPDDFVRGEHSLEVTGADAVRRSIGLDSE